MKMVHTGGKKSLRTRVFGFFSDESGAVTVDWVVLAAFLAVLGLGITVKITQATDYTLSVITKTVEEQQAEMVRLGAGGDDDSDP